MGSLFASPRMSSAVLLPLVRDLGKDVNCDVIKLFMKPLYPK